MLTAIVLINHSVCCNNKGRPTMQATLILAGHCERAPYDHYLVWIAAKANPQGAPVCRSRAEIQRAVAPARAKTTKQPAHGPTTAHNSCPRRAICCERAGWARCSSSDAHVKWR
jgi:hypothetical protein